MAEGTAPKHDPARPLRLRLRLRLRRFDGIDLAVVVDTQWPRAKCAGQVNQGLVPRAPLASSPVVSATTCAPLPPPRAGRHTPQHVLTAIAVNIERLSKQPPGEGALP
ncbi:hypothetical protein LN042_29110 [Kitasatospora sp. RB6PN24]|uniref:hypothetical protein n=1 Tax=Kitasatospora humi TaxID=2893891 RepID=UPI001E4EDA27|nr:hypothetical protein [Kitasatospora humi]MCC9311078.1 hypothetical protein [Kitasatospora humi]